MDDRRVFQRFRVDLPLRFVCQDKNIEGRGRMIDISAEGGGMIITCEELNPPMHLEMWMDLLDNKEPFHSSAEVVWSNRIEPNLYKAGVKFDKVDFIGISRVLRLRNR